MHMQVVPKAGTVEYFCNAVDDTFSNSYEDVTLIYRFYEPNEDMEVSNIDYNPEKSRGKSALRKKRDALIRAICNDVADDWGKFSIIHINQKYTVKASQNQEKVWHKGRWWSCTFARDQR